ncbi:MAG: hypothetical protein AABX89_05290 [Candidatus Thermoplasmatota archaeon]
MRIPAADRALTVLGYLPFLFFIPVRFRRQSLFAQFHGRQSGVLFALWFILCIILFVVLAFVGAGLSIYFFGVIFVATFVYLFFMIVGMAKVLLGERYRMPVVADVALLLRL